MRGPRVERKMGTYVHAINLVNRERGRNCLVETFFTEDTIEFTIEEYASQLNGTVWVEPESSRPVPETESPANTMGTAKKEHYGEQYKVVVWAYWNGNEYG
jgi:hypothetical protein